LARIAFHGMQRHHLGARNAVQIGQLEAQEFDPVALQFGERLGNVVFGLGHEETPSLACRSGHEICGSRVCYCRLAAAAKASATILAASTELLSLATPEP